MGPVRAIGLLFIMTILVGGCILANSSPEQTETTDQVVSEISWDVAENYLQTGAVLTLDRRELVLVLALKDGRTVWVSIPSEEVLREIWDQCVSHCETLDGLSL